MRHWIGLVMVGCAALAVRFLPPSEWTPPERLPTLPEVVYEERLRDEAATANARLVRFRVADQVIPATLGHDGPLALDFPERADAEQVARATELATAEAEEALSDGGRDVALGLFYTYWRDLGHPGAPTATVPEVEYYFGERDGRAYCAAVMPTWRTARDGTVHLSGVPNSRSRLGVCQFVARYGLPGGAAQAWLERGGTALTATLAPSSETSFTFSSGFGTRFERRGILGLPVAAPGMRSYRTVAQEQCFAGVREGCATLFGSPSGQHSVRYFYMRGAPEQLIATTPLSAVQSYSAMEPADRHVAADLVAEFGEERFTRFWSADGDLDEAFVQAFGVAPGTWYAERTARLITFAPPGPRVAGVGLLGVLLIVGLATVVGGGWAGRRRVA
jgi:hypothetical protein